MKSSEHLPGPRPSKEVWKGISGASKSTVNYSQTANSWRYRAGVMMKVPIAVADDPGNSSILVEFPRREQQRQRVASEVQQLMETFGCETEPVPYCNSVGIAITRGRHFWNPIADLRIIAADYVPADREMSPYRDSATLVAETLPITPDAFLSSQLYDQDALRRVVNFVKSDAESLYYSRRRMGMSED